MLHNDCAEASTSHAIVNIYANNLYLMTAPFYYIARYFYLWTYWSTYKQQWSTL